MALRVAKGDEAAGCGAKYCRFSELPSRDREGADADVRSVINGAGYFKDQVNRWCCVRLFAHHQYAPGYKSGNGSRTDQNNKRSRRVERKSDVPCPRIDTLTARARSNTGSTRFAVLSDPP